MNKLKISLQSNAGKFIFLTISSSLYIFTKTSYLAIALLIILLIYLSKKAQSLLLYALLLMILINVRINSFNNQNLSSGSLINAEIINVNDEALVVRNHGKYLIYVDDVEGYKPGDIIQTKIQGVNISQRNIPHTFDYETYLKSQGIKNVFKAFQIKKINHRFNINIINFKVKEYFEKNFENPTKNYINLFVTGDKSGLDEELLNTSNALGISHLFAISGMHLALLIGFLKKILKQFYMQKKSHDIIIICFLIAYNIITGFKVSILRASLLVVSIYLKDYLKLVLSSSDLLTFSFVGFLLYNPYIMFSVGFQLSYLMAYTIILGQSIYRDNNYIKQLLKLSLYASLISMPIILELNRTYGFLNVFANVFFVPYISLVLLPFTFLTLIFPFLNNVYIELINIFESGVLFFSKINIFIDINFPHSVEKIIYWALLIMLFIFIQNRKRVTLILLSLLMFVLVVYTFNFIPNVDFVRILDVQQGDAIHLHSKSCNMMIDSGSRDKYDSLHKYLEGYNIKTLDFLIVTHLHEDHYGGGVDLVKSVNIKNIIINRNNTLFSDYIIGKNLDKISCGNINLEILSSNNNDDNENNNSLVLVAKIGYDNWLFTGDIEKAAEDRIIKEYDLNIDVLKVPHHGSNTSSSNSFLNAVSPKIAVISVGKYNEYDFPDSQVLNRLQGNNISIYRTDESGTITFYYQKSINLRIIETNQFMQKKKYKFHFF